MSPSVVDLTYSDGEEVRSSYESCTETFKDQESPFSNSDRRCHYSHTPFISPRTTHSYRSIPVDRAGGTWTDRHKKQHELYCSPYSSKRPLSQRDSPPSGTARKRMRYDSPPSIDVHGARSSRAHVGPFIDTSSSDEEIDHFGIRGSHQSERSSRGSALQQHDYERDGRLWGQNKFVTTTKDDIHQYKSSPGATITTHLPCSSTKIKTEPNDDDLGFERTSPPRKRPLLRPEIARVNEDHCQSTAAFTSTRRATTEEEEKVRTVQTTSNRPSNHLVGATNPTETFKRKDPETYFDQTTKNRKSVATPDEIKRRFIKTTPAPVPRHKTKHQQWLKQNSRIVSHSARNAGKFGVVDIDCHEARPPRCIQQRSTEDADPAIQPKSQPPCTKTTFDSPGPQSADVNGPNVKTSTLTPTATSTAATLSSYELKRTQANTLSFHESSLSENERSLIAWRDSGMSWDNVILEWQKKTGLAAAQSTLRKKYKQAKICIASELRGFQIAQQQHQESNVSHDTEGKGAIAPSFEDSQSCETICGSRDSPSPSNKLSATGGKTFSNEMWAAKMAELKEAQADEKRLEYEQTPGFFRDPSDLPGETDDPVYYVYRVFRKTWLTPEQRDSATWYRFVDAKTEFTSLFEANAAAIVESSRKRLEVGMHMRYERYSGSYQDDMYQFAFEAQDGSGFEVKVQREMVRYDKDNKMALAESKLGWFRKRVFVIFKRTETIMQPAISHDKVADLFEAPERSTVEVRETQVGQVYTVADQANRVAADVLLDLVAPRSSRLDVMDKRDKLRDQLKEQNDVNEAESKLLEVDFDKETGLKGKVWVEQRYLEGPRNI